MFHLCILPNKQNNTKVTGHSANMRCMGKWWQWERFMFEHWVSDISNLNTTA